MENIFLLFEGRGFSLWYSFRRAVRHMSENILWSESRTESIFFAICGSECATVALQYSVFRLPTKPTQLMSSIPSKCASFHTVHRHLLYDKVQFNWQYHCVPICQHKRILAAHIFRYWLWICLLSFSSQFYWQVNYLLKTLLAKPVELAKPSVIIWQQSHWVVTSRESWIVLCS